MPGVEEIRVPRFPGLAQAMDGGAMRPHVEALVGPVATIRPKAFVDGPTCRVQYAAGPQLVLGRLFGHDRQAQAYDRDEVAPLAAGRPTAVVGALALWPFPVSPELPGLLGATDPVPVGDLVGERPAGIDLVRFTRTPRCTLRYRLAGGTNLYGKVARDLSPHAGAVLDALTAAGVTVPRVVADAPGLALRVFTELAGERPAITPGLLATAAAAAARIHSAAAGALPVRTLRSDAAAARAAVASIAGDAPELASGLAALVGDGGEADRVGLAHGDFTPSQLVVSEGPGRVGVLDLDDACRAEPALDLGRFSAYVRVAMGAAAGPGLEDALAGEYRRAGGGPVTAERIRRYERLSLVLMGVHSWQRLKPHRLARVVAAASAVASTVIG